MPVNFYHLLIELARIHARSTPLERVLESLGDAVTESSKVIDRARGGKNDDYFQSVQDDESDVVESLVGAAFVAAQTHITAIVSVIKRLIARAKKDGQALISSDGTKQGIMRFRRRPRAQVVRRFRGPVQGSDRDAARRWGRSLPASR